MRGRVGWTSLDELGGELQRWTHVARRQQRLDARYRGVLHDQR
jgi:hypothetical protein